MRKNNYIISYLLALSAIISFFIGFSIDEVSMGAGGFDEDFSFVRKSILLFENYSTIESIKYFSETSNRPPLIYILHKHLNPFFTDELGFRKVVFGISLIAPLLFYLCLKEKFNVLERPLLLLLSSVLFLNPFFRTSAYWGLEENYAIISSLFSILFLIKFNKQNKKDYLKIYLWIFLITFFSSLSIYFDQKFLIIPLICFFKIIFEKLTIKIKIFCITMYLIFSIPYLYLINLWGGIFPSSVYNLGREFYYHHFGYAVTIIAFIFFPFIFLKSQSFKNQIYFFLNDKKSYFYLIIIFFYLTILFFLVDDSFLLNNLDGGGIIKKISFILFPNMILKKIFTCIAILVSWIILIVLMEKNKINFYLTFYFLCLSLIIRPFFQEYFDPIIFLLLFFIYKIKLKFSYNKAYLLYAYYLIFLVGTNLYYN